MAFDRKEFTKKLIYQKTAPLRVITSDLYHIAKLDQWAEQQKRKFINWLILSSCLLIVSIILLATSTSSVLSSLGVIILIASLMGIIFTGIQCYHFSRINLENLRYQVAKKILAMLGRDSNLEKNFSINLNFTKPTAVSKKYSTNNHPYRNGWKLEIYHDLWLNLRGIFLDNTKFQLTILDINQVSSGWKRSRSGKRKYKTKTKFKKFEVAITLKYPLKKYGAVKLIKLSDAQTAIKLPNWATCTKISISERAIFLRVKVDSKRDLEDVCQLVTMMFLSLYQILNLAKILAKKLA